MTQRTELMSQLDEVDEVLAALKTTGYSERAFTITSHLTKYDDTRHLDINLPGVFLHDITEILSQYRANIIGALATHGITIKE